MSAIALLKIDGSVFILMVYDKSRYLIQGFKDVADGVRFFEEGYMRAHKRGYEGSMSACLSMIQAQPSIIEASVEDIKTWIGEDAQLYDISGLADPGRKGLKVLPKYQKVWDKGEKPRLIADEG